MEESVSALDKIIERAETLVMYGNATHIPEMAEMIFTLAKMVKELKQPIPTVPYNPNIEVDPYKNRRTEQS